MITHITKKMIQEHHTSLFTTQEPPVAFLDIETTGFHRTHHHVMLLGWMTIQGHELVLTQWFAESAADERELLTSFIKATQKPYVVYTFNGARFDWPFIEARLAFHELTYHTGHFFRVDLLDWAKKIDHPVLTNRKLKTVEKLLQIDRQDTISGKENVLLYRRYCQAPNKTLLNQMLLHNADDIFNMLPLLKMADFLKPHDQLALVVRPSTSQTYYYTATFSDSNCVIHGLLLRPKGSFFASKGDVVRFDDHAFLINFRLYSDVVSEKKITFTHYLNLSDLLKQTLKPSSCVLIVDGQVHLEHLEGLIGHALNLL